MNELEKYVETLFKNQKHSPDTHELKEEILCNLKEKYADLISQNIDEPTALKATKESIQSIEDLIDSNHLIYINQFKIECWQLSLQYILIGWILSMPLLYLGASARINILLFLSIICLGISFLTNYSKLKKNHSQQEYLNTTSYHKMKTITWLLWIIWFVINIVWFTGVRFGSTIWFHRPITIDGPYDFANVVAGYYSPLITIIIPLIASRCYNLLSKYKVGDYSEI